MFDWIRRDCGRYRHSAAIGERSEVYLWGSNQYGQLGHGGLGDEARPRVLLLDREEPPPLSLESAVSPQALLSANGQEMRAVTIACGGGHTVQSEHALLFHILDAKKEVSFR